MEGKSKAQRPTIAIHFEVGPHHHGWRLDRFIKARVPRLSRTRIQKMIRAQRELAGVELRPSERVRHGQRLTLIRPAPVEPDVPRRYDVLFDDEHLLAICKPAGLPVHATARFHRNTLTALLREQHAPGEEPRLVHRIDKETSGVMLLARERQTEVALKRALARREVRKRYLAIVHGDPGERGAIDLSIGPDTASGIRIKQGVDAAGLPALTRWRRIDKRADYALVEAAPHTGRQHQIRVHLAAIGHPIVGDKLYGPDPSLMLEYLETGWTERLAARLTLPRQALHASSIEFGHPHTGSSMRVDCPLTEDLQRFWDDAGEGGS